MINYLTNLKLWVLYYYRSIQNYFNKLSINQREGIFYVLIILGGLILVLSIVFIILSIIKHKKKLRYASESLATKDKEIIAEKVEAVEKEIFVEEKKLEIEKKEVTVKEKKPEPVKPKATVEEKKPEPVKPKAIEEEKRAEETEKKKIAIEDKEKERALKTKDIIKNRFIRQVKSDLETEFINIINRYFPEKIHFKEKFLIEEEIINKCNSILEKLNTISQDKEIIFSNNYYPSISIFYYITGQDDLFEENIKKEIQLFPTNDTPLIQAAAFSLYNQDSLDQAEQYCIKAKEINPSNFDIYFLLSEIYFKRENFVETLNILKKIILLDPKNSTAYAYKGYFLAQQGYVSDGEKDLRKAISMDFKNFIPYYFLGNIYKNIQFYEKAGAFYEKALKFDCAFLEVKENLALCLLKMKKYGMVIKLLKPLAEKKFLSVNGSQFLSDAYKNKQNYKKAVDLLIAAYEKYKNTDAAKELELRIGDIYYHNLKNYIEAETYYSRFLEKESDNYLVNKNLEQIDYQKSKIRLHNNLGVIYAQSGNYNEAIKEFKKALEIDKNNKETIFNLQKANKLLGEKDEQDQTIPLENIG